MFQQPFIKIDQSISGIVASGTDYTVYVHDIYI